MIKKVNDKYVERSSLASAGGNPNKVFKLIYGAERRDLFKKYAQEQHRFPKKSYNGVGELDFNDINTWIKPIPFLGEGEYWDEDDFDEIIKTLQEEDESNRQSKELALKQKEQEKPETKENQKEKLEEYTEKKVPLKEGPGIEYLGIGGKYRIYAVTSPEGAQQFAVPASMNNVKGWCITGGKGPKWKWGSNSHFDSEASRTINRTFYVFETENIADNWCVYILKNGRDGAHLGFTPNDTDQNYYGIPKGVEDVPYMQVPILAEYAAQTPKLNETKKGNSEVNGIYNFRGNTLLRIIDTDVTELDIPVAYTRIAPNAFTDLHNLESIHFGNTLESIGQNAFTGCTNLKHVDLNSNNLLIGEEAFSYCTGLEKINIRGVNVIPSGAFHNCSNLRAIDLSPNLTTIGTDAFLGCDKLTGLHLNENCQTIGNNAFFKCKNLTISTDFEERPAGWYKNIENHVRAIEYANVSEENQTTDSVANPYIIKRLDKDYFYSEYKDYPDWTYYVDSATKFASKEEAEEKINALQSDWQDIYEIVSLEDYRNSLKKIEISDFKPMQINDDYYHGGIPRNAEEISVGLYSTGEYQKNIEPKDKTIYLVLPKKKAYIKTNQEDYYKSPLSKSHIMFYSYPQDTLEEVEEIAKDIISKCDAKLVSEDVYLSLKDEDSEEKVHEIFENFNKRKMNDSEIVSVWQMFKADDCAGWIFKMDDNPELCIAMPSNQLSFLEETEESMSDELIVEEKLPISEYLYIYIGHGVGEDVFVSDNFIRNGEKLMTISEAIEDIKNSWRSDGAKINDSEMVIDTEAKDEEITPEEQEVKEIVVNFSIQELAKEALDDLKSAKDNDELEDKYNKWINKSDDLLSEDKITISQQEEFEDELWEHFKNLMQ